MKTSNKLAILQSLNTLDNAQMEEVADYIRQVQSQEYKRKNRKSRQQAMEQIRKALQPQQVLRPPL